ncbi:TraR/DksA C4-type zinc finger protein [Candidatus Methylocalor cossyra]
MDDIDFAQHLEECDRNDALRRLRSAQEMAELQLVDEARGAVICLDCGAPIPDERLAVQRQAVRCIDCQREHDREQLLEARLYTTGNEL